MSAQRKAIRKQIVRILTGRTRARKNVRASRGEPNWQENLPAINVYTRGEAEIEELSEAPRNMRRVLEVEVEIIDEGPDGEPLADQLDDFAEQVERCLSVDDSLGGCADDIVLTSVSEMEVETGGKKPVGSIKLNFKVLYHEYAPRDRKGQGRFDNLDDINAEWDIQPGQDELDRAEDSIDLTTP